jgi:hypothetical protein
MKKEIAESEKWTPEERDNIVGVFQILLEMDKKQNPGNYKKKQNHREL